MRVGLALSGGGARGIAHLGAIKAMLENDIKPDIISGVSSGAIVGALYSSGLHPDEIMSTLLRTRIFRYIRPAWSKVGFLNIQKLLAIYKLYLPVHTFEELKGTLIISAADIREGKTVYFTEGNLAKAILASSCIPILFTPIEMEGKLLVDGGIINNLPVEPLISRCDLIIGVHCNPTHRKYKVGNIKSMLERTFHLSISNNVKERMKYCDMFIEPPQLINYALFEISKAKEIYKVGYDHAIKVINASQDLLAHHRGIRR
jgi:NTE family protein